MHYQGAPSPLNPLPTDVDDDPSLLNTYLTEILQDTYGTSSSRQLIIALALPHSQTSTRMHISHILTALQTHHPRTHAQILRQYLNTNPSVKIHLWKHNTNDPQLYNSCTPNGTCGYQFLYQLDQRRHRQLHPSQPSLPDQFPNITSREHMPNYKRFLNRLLNHIKNSPFPDHRHTTAITKLTYYIHWLSLPHKPTFEQQHWLDSTSLFLLTNDTPHHFSYAMIDPNNATPYISDDWLYVNDDTEFQHIAPNFTVHAADTIIRRNNFGKFQNYHYSPLPSSPTENTDLDTALSSYAQRLITKFTGTLPLTSHLVQFRYRHITSTNQISSKRQKRSYLTETTTIPTQPTTSSITNVEDHTTTSITTTNTTYTYSLPYLPYNPNAPSPTTNTPTPPPSPTTTAVNTNRPITPWTLSTHRPQSSTNSLRTKTTPTRHPRRQHKTTTNHTTETHNSTANIPFLPIITPWSQTHSGNRFAAFSDASTTNTQTTSATPSITSTSNISYSLHSHITHHTNDPLITQPPPQHITNQNTDTLANHQSPHKRHTDIVQPNRHPTVIHIIPNTYTPQRRHHRNRKTKKHYQDPLPSPTTPHLMQLNPPTHLPLLKNTDTTITHAQPNFIQTNH